MRRAAGVVMAVCLAALPSSAAEPRPSPAPAPKPPPTESAAALDARLLALPLASRCELAHLIAERVAAGFSQLRAWEPATLKKAALVIWLAGEPRTSRLVGPEESCAPDGLLPIAGAASGAVLSVWIDPAPPPFLRFHGATATLCPAGKLCYQPRTPPPALEVVVEQQANGWHLVRASMALDLGER